MRLDPLMEGFRVEGAGIVGTGRIDGRGVDVGTMGPDERAVAEGMIGAAVGTVVAGTAVGIAVAVGTAKGTAVSTAVAGSILCPTTGMAFLISIAFTSRIAGCAGRDTDGSADSRLAM